MSRSDGHTQLAILGAGPGGYAAAFRAASLGVETTLIDPRPLPGGVCLHEGCIPSKALLHAAALVEEARSAEAIGLHFEGLVIESEQLRDWSSKTVERLSRGLAALCRSRGVRTLHATARFCGDRELSLESADGKARTLRFDNAIIATGSRPIPLPGLDLESARVWDAGRALALESVPKRLLVAGGGYIGLELGMVYAALGSGVVLVEATDDLLPGVDRELVAPLAKRTEERFEAVFRKTRIAELDERRGRLFPHWEGSGAEEDAGGFDAVLVAVGREPASDDLGLERAGVELREGGFIVTDSQCRTSDPHIFAIGDVVGEPMLAHKAMREGKVAAEVVAGEPARFDSRAIPCVVFTEPEVAWCGRSEEEARRAGFRIAVGRFPWRASGRAATRRASGRERGLTKLVFEAATGRLLGAGVTGAGAGELIAEAVLALEMGATAEDLAANIHPHPTLSEGWAEAAELAFGSATHYDGAAAKRGPSSAEAAESDATDAEEGDES